MAVKTYVHRIGRELALRENQVQPANAAFDIGVKAGGLDELLKWLQGPHSLLQGRYSVSGVGPDFKEDMMVELFTEVGSVSAERSEQTIYDEAQELIKQGGVRRLVHIIRQLQDLAHDDISAKLHDQMESLRSTKVYCSDACRKRG